MAANANRFFSITTPLKRAKFREAYAAAQVAHKSIVEIIAGFQAEAMGDIQGGATVKAASANGHSTMLTDPGQGSAAAQEFVEMWEDLTQRCEAATRFLATCNTYGLDAFQTVDSLFPNPLPAPVDPAVIVDLTGEWNLLCVQYGIDPATVVDVGLDQPAIFVWVLTHLQAVTQGMGDFSGARLTPGPSYI